jgi:hypothetical protein
MLRELSLKVTIEQLPSRLRGTAEPDQFTHWENYRKTPVCLLTSTATRVLIGAVLEENQQQQRVRAEGCLADILDLPDRDSVLQWSAIRQPLAFASRKYHNLDRQ